MYQDYVETGMRVFALHKVEEGVCGCGDVKCKALCKHPRARNWQATPLWEPEQLEAQERFFKSGFGVLVEGYLVIDVDARNGGLQGLEALELAFPELLMSCEFIVNTGSGGGSKHLYFKLPASQQKLVQTHKNFLGIDFKTSGFVVGAGSIHKSGNKYKAVLGMPGDITEAPQVLIELLQRPLHHKAEFDGSKIEFTEIQLKELLQYITNHDAAYEKWIQVGMALHDCTAGTGLELWNSWSKSTTPTKHDDNTSQKSWHSFGKSVNKITAGTLIHLARENGYIMHSNTQPEITTSKPSSVDLQNPPGFVGELCAWINNQCLYPRKNLAVAAALQIVSNLAGMRFADAMDGVTSNLISFCVAGSGTGKESLLKAFSECMRLVDLHPAMYGSFKSEQELYRNLIRHQGAFYAIDELGIHLSKIKNASTKGGASYLEGLLGAVMSASTKADSFLAITGDLKEEIRALISRELVSVNKQLDDKPSPYLESKLISLERQLKTIDNGIEKPFLSILGYTTPSTFDNLFDFETATNGFLSRALIFKEQDNNPRRKEDFKKQEMSEQLKRGLQLLANGGKYSVTDEMKARIEFLDEKTPISTTPDAKNKLQEVYRHFWNQAEELMSKSGLEAIPRRGWELVSKVSLILALKTGVRELQDVVWAFELVKCDIDSKISLATANTSDNMLEQLCNKIVGNLGKEWTLQGTLKNKCRSSTAEEFQAALDYLVANTIIAKQEVPHSSKKSISVTKYLKL